MIRQVKPIDVSADSLSSKTRPEQTPEDSSKWKTFASNTTLHGLRFVCDDGYPVWRRGIWLVFLCFNTGLLFYFLTISMNKYLSLPIKTVISHETPTNGLTFPAVTICNLNKFMRSKIDVADDDERFENMGLNISGCIQTRAVRGNLTCGQALLCAYRPYGPALVNGCNETMRQNIIKALNASERLFNEEEFFIKYGHEIRSMFVVFCQFNKIIPCSDEDFVPTLTRAGICFTFNSGYNNALLRSVVEGPDYGFNIILDVQTNESTINEFSSGLKVIVHKQNTFVNRHTGFNIMPGTHARVAIEMTKILQLKAPYRTSCRESDLPGIGSYTKEGCRFQCFFNHTMKECGCRPTGFPGQASLPVCSLQDSGCMEESRKTFNSTPCQCNAACAKLAYKPSVSYSKFADLSRIFEHYLGMKEGYSYMRDNYVFLQVGFHKHTYERREDVPSYGAESLLGEFGGNMGLFLGCSLVTLCEFFDFFWDSLKARIRKRRATEVSTGPLH